MNNDIKWITVNGTHIPIKSGQSESDAVKEFTDWQEQKRKTQEKSIDELKKEAVAKTSDKLPKINLDDRWAYQPGDVDPDDLRENPIEYVGIDNEQVLGEAIENGTKQSEYKSDVDFPIDKLKTLQPFVLASGIDNYRRWDETERPYVVQYKGGYYLMDGNHRAAIAKLKGEKTIKVDLSIREDR